MQAQHSTWLFTRWIWFFLIGVQQQIEEGTIYPTRGLHNPGYIALFGILIGIAQILAAILAVTREIPVLTPVDALPLLPAEDCLIFDVRPVWRNEPVHRDHARGSANGPCG